MLILGELYLRAVPFEYQVHYSTTRPRRGRGLPVIRHSARLSAKDRCKALAVGPRGLAAFNRAAASGIHTR
jgi:hypothetical protein